MAPLSFFREKHKSKYNALNRFMSTELISFFESHRMVIIVILL